MVYGSEIYVTVVMGPCVHVLSLDAQTRVFLTYMNTGCESEVDTDQDGHEDTSKSKKDRRNQSLFIFTAKAYI